MFHMEHGPFLFWAELFVCNLAKAQSPPSPAGFGIERAFGRFYRLKSAIGYLNALESRLIILSN